MYGIHILIKPSSSYCNMRCKYCFYFDEVSHRETESYGFMNNETMELVIDKAIDYVTNHITFAFQGGEPTLIGLDYFRRFVAYVEKRNTKNLQVSFAIQTNGYVLDAEWAKFFHEKNFLVGLSMDGSKDIHDRYRLDAAGKGTYNRVLQVSQLFDKYKVEYNILSVVTKPLAKSIQKNYRFFMRNNFSWQQYIPCLDPIAAERGTNEYSLTAEAYADFLKQLFDLWHKDVMGGKLVSIRYFDNLIGMMLGQPPESCGMSGRCSNQYVVEANGQVYPCDFYMMDEYLLGNICTQSLAEIDAKRTEMGFVEKSFKVEEDCKQCKWGGLCRGGCRRDRENFATGEIGKTYLCGAYKDFFEYAYPKMVEICKMIQSRSQMQRG